MPLDTKYAPAPRWSATAWLSAPATQLAPDVAAKLRTSMFRRLEAVLASAPLTVGIAILAVSRHPTSGFVGWLAADAVLLFFRVTLVVYIMRHIRRGVGIDPRTTDVFILVGTLWSALLGYGACLTMLSNDPSLIIIVLFVCTAVLAVQTVRNPSSPRMNCVQMSLILLPLAVAAVFSSFPLIRWGGVFWPIYLVAMTNMSRQIYDDYVAMIVARIENRKRALHCSLTGLANRGCFDESLGAALREAVMSNACLAVLCIDLDGFKQVNDRFGHPLGDALLVAVAERLTSLIRSTDLAARLGGDEFAILMRVGDREGAEGLAARINRVIAEPFTLQPDVTITIGASVGILVVDGKPGSERISASTVMTRADQALYAAKHAGKGTFRRFDDCDCMAA